MIKLGGSLLTLPDLGRRVRAALEQRPQCRPLIVVGGGAAVDVVRDWDRLHHLGDELAHRLAIEAMAVTALLAVAILDGAAVVANLDEAEAAWQQEGALPVLLVEPVLTALEAQNGDPLPRSWAVTSDSIAAWLAPRVNAAELVLLKSEDFPAGGIEAAVDNGAIDAYFPKLLGRAPRLTWVNLRAKEPRFVDCVWRVMAGDPTDV